MILYGLLFGTGCSAVWLAHLVWDQGVAGSNPVTPTKMETFAKAEVFLCAPGRAHLLDSDYYEN